MIEGENLSTQIHELCTSSIRDEIIWFCFQGVMVHTLNTMKEPSKILQYLLKCFFMFKVGILYYNNDVLDTHVIKCIKCENFFGYYLKNKTLK